MIVNLFSVFDPRTQVLRLNWLSVLIVFLILPCWYWVLSSRFMRLWWLVIGSLKGEFTLLLGSSKGVGVLFVVLGLFRFIVVNNVFGLIPYVFTGTAHFSITVSLALPL